MRIVNVMLGQGLGGIEQAIVDYCEALRLTGHEAVAVIHPEASIAPELKALGIECHRLDNQGAWDVFAIFQLWRLLKRLAPDACVAHGNRAISLLKMAKAPRLIGVMHNYKIKCAKLRFVFYPTQDLLRHVRQACGAGVHAYHLPNMVRVPEHQKRRISHTPPVIGSMGRFVAKKGFALFIESLALLKKRGVRFRAVLAGEGEEKQALMALAAEKDLGEQLEFAGWAKDKQAFFDSIDLFCLSSHHEPFGIVLLEAMAQGLPVVATASEGPSEILEAGEPGAIVPKGNPAALAEAFALMLADPARALLLGRNAYETAKSRYNLPVIAHKLDLALQQVCRL